ncbi:ASCH domain-containing protein [Sporosarcina ureae]|uniref:ASCH domain-containing protein n=1 Tax=Sporosarcina ureae TaxID=1571 RepID=UPI0026F058EA|nr:ASCH domain-containing protein [Sporosarcina ureae]
MTNYPEKTCSIERLVTIPEDVQKVLNGEKWATRRNGVYAYPGEIMTLEGKEYKVEKLYEQTLGELTDEDAKSEGHKTVEEYKEAMLSIHDKMPWLPKMKVWVHEYSPVQK